MAWILVPLQFFNLLNHLDSFILVVVHLQDDEEFDLLMKILNIYKDCGRVWQPRPWNDVWEERMKILETADALW